MKKITLLLFAICVVFLAGCESTKDQADSRFDSRGRYQPYGIPNIRAPNGVTKAEENEVRRRFGIPTRP